MQKECYMKSESGRIFITENPSYWYECEKLSKTEGKRLLAEQAKWELREILNNGETVYTVLRSVSASGMSRKIDLYVFKDNKPRYLSGLYAQMQGEKVPSNGYRVGGCGMDMGFHLVYTLSSMIFEGERKGYKLKHEWL
jgi:hypothetical protein